VVCAAADTVSVNGFHAPFHKVQIFLPAAPSSKINRIWSSSFGFTYFRKCLNRMGYSFCWRPSRKRHHDCSGWAPFKEKWILPWPWKGQPRRNTLCWHFATHNSVSGRSFSISLLSFEPNYFWLFFETYWCASSVAAERTTTLKSCFNGKSPSKGNNFETICLLHVPALAANVHPEALRWDEGEASVSVCRIIFKGMQNVVSHCEFENQAP